jgi:hypothetical protein
MCCRDRLLIEVIGFYKAGIFEAIGIFRSQVMGF